MTRTRSSLAIIQDLDFLVSQHSKTVEEYLAKKKEFEEILNQIKKTCNSKSLN